MITCQVNISIKIDRGATIFIFNDKRLENQNLLDNAFDHIGRLAANTLVLNFRNVDDMSSFAIAKLITLKKGVEKARGQLFLCCIRPSIMEQLVTMGMVKFFNIRETQEEILKDY
ncbi:MAG: STAS domain-containing protein [bacterium]|nr:STAS domain-containing protein [bacterium]